MLNLNRLELVGNLTKEPEMRFTPNNQAVTNFAIATNRRYQDKAGVWQDSPAEFHDVVVWGPLGERCNQVLHKGDRVFATGRLQTRSWEAQDGSKKYRTELVADTIIGPDLVNKNMGGVQGGSGEGFEQAPTQRSQPAAQAPAAEDEINIDDIPF